MKMNRIDEFFTSLKAEKRRALIPFFTAGDPDLETTALLVRAAFERGAGLVEIGVPYSDPIADGPVIAESYTRALRQGVRVDSVFDMIKRFRQDASKVAGPIVTMVSYSIVLKRGIDRYLGEAKVAGVDGLIVPDLPVEEAGGLARSVRDQDLRLIQLVTPTTPSERAVKIAETTSGFLYYVSVAGITGERKALPADLEANVGRLRERTSLPICVGFGIADPEQVRALAPVADGLIVGSALVRRIADARARGLSQAAVVAEIGGFIAELADALKG